MNAPVSIDTSPVIVSNGWHRSLPPVFIGLLLLGLLFSKEVETAVHTWNTSTAYNHCFLVIPITLYLLWDRRFDVVGIPVRPMPAVVLLGLPLAALWLLAERLGIMEGRQLAVVSFAQLLFLVVLGKRLWRAVSGPLLYLYFLVPFGDFLTPVLQDTTTFFISNGLAILGVPAYIDGYVIEIPQGTFFVAEACAGLRFLIASVAFGCLYALMIYRSPLRRGVFIAVSIIVPVIANGLRGIGIVCLGYVLGSAQAAAADHIIYGWIFFSAVILLLLTLGLPFRQDEMFTAPPPSVSVRFGTPVSVQAAFAAALGVAVIAAISPAVAAGLAFSAATPVLTPPLIPFGPDCEVQTSAATLAIGSAVKDQRVVCGSVRMRMTWEAFSPRSTAAPLMAERRRLVSRALTEGLAENWLPSADGRPSAWRIMKSTDPAYITAVAIWLRGQPVRPGLAMRLRMALDSLTGSPFAPMIVTVTPDVDWDTSDLRALESSLPDFLLSHATLDQSVGALSRLP